MLEWEVVGMIDWEDDVRYIMDEYGTAVPIPYTGESYYFQTH